jgi:hypothetical protein
MLQKVWDLELDLRAAEDPDSEPLLVSLQQPFLQEDPI